MHMCTQTIFLGQKNVRVKFCNCLSEPETLVYLGLFPATPKMPGLAFTNNFMNWLNAVTLECQVASQDYVHAWNFLQAKYMIEVCH